ncbi:hypothetical protein [Corynebacterium sp. CCUG 51687]|uniref:hypothetical protein n=1 Tax=Corynebacterium sp. CCUG 51687 TaxID=2823897 RepID=UPI0021094432|nr:hypothetical protein [Corynebacterium sp. CCUG 51687]MCQ4611871.1 hypothetical protein [Corynebacterium sp. CCUG 51687]
MTQIEIQGPQVPLLVEIVMARLQEVTQRCSELERALSDVPRTPPAEVQRLAELKVKLQKANRRAGSAEEYRTRLQEELKKSQEEREEALESARVLRKKNQNLASEADSLRKQLLEERESAEAERKTREEAERQRTHAKGQATKAKRELATLREKLKEMEEQSARSGATSWRSVERHLDIALNAFEDDPDKSFNALMRAKHALENEAGR